MKVQNSSKLSQKNYHVRIEFTGKNLISSRVTKSFKHDAYLITDNTKGHAPEAAGLKAAESFG